MASNKQKYNPYTVEPEYVYDEQYKTEYEYGIKALDTVKHQYCYDTNSGKTFNGQVYTPLFIVVKMNDLAKQELGQLDKTVLDPCCGTGNITIDILRRRLTSALINRYAPDGNDHLLEYLTLGINNIFACDIDEQAVLQCRDRLTEMINNWFDLLIADNLTTEYVKQQLGHNLKFDEHIIVGDFLSFNSED